ncbi:hypothetical protein [Paenibacillus tundrae]
MAKQTQALEEKMGFIAQAQVAYEQLMDEISSYCKQARGLREQAAELQRSGRTDFQVSEEIQELLNQA